MQICRLKAIWFGPCPDQPLLYLEEKFVEISPAPPNRGERLEPSAAKAEDGKAVEKAYGPPLARHQPSTAGLFALREGPLEAG